MNQDRRLSFWSSYIDYKITGDRIYSVRVKGEPAQKTRTPKNDLNSLFSSDAKVNLPDKLEVKLEELYVPSGGIKVGTQDFDNARKLFPSFSHKSDAELYGHIEGLADDVAKSKLPGQIKYNAQQTAGYLIFCFIILIVLQALHVGSSKALRKLPPSNYTKKAGVISIGWVIAVYVWAAIEYGDGLGAAHNSIWNFHRDLLLLPPAAFLAIALLWAKASGIKMTANLDDV